MTVFRLKQLASDSVHAAAGAVRWNYDKVEMIADESLSNRYAADARRSRACRGERGALTLGRERRAYVAADRAPDVARPLGEVCFEPEPPPLRVTPDDLEPS